LPVYCDGGNCIERGRSKQNGKRQVPAAAQQAGWPMRRENAEQEQRSGDGQPEQVAAGKVHGQDVDAQRGQPPLEMCHDRDEVQQRPRHDEEAQDDDDRELEAAGQHRYDDGSVRPSWTCPVPVSRSRVGRRVAVVGDLRHQQHHCIMTTTLIARHLHCGLSTGRNSIS